MKIKSFKLFNESIEQSYTNQDYITSPNIRRAKVTRTESEEGHNYIVTTNKNETVTLLITTDNTELLDQEALRWLLNTYKAGISEYPSNRAKYMDSVRMIEDEGFPLPDKIWNELNRAANELSDRNKYNKLCWVQMTHNNSMELYIPGVDSYTYRLPLKWGDNEFNQENIGEPIILNADQKALMDKLKNAALDRGKSYVGYKKMKVDLYPHEIELAKYLYQMSHE